jgi:hypothetical protein
MRYELTDHELFNKTKQYRYSLRQTRCQLPCRHLGCGSALMSPRPSQVGSSSVSSPLSNCVGWGGQPRICRSTGTTPETPPTTA